MAVGRDLLRRCTRLNVKDDGVPSELRLTSYNRRILQDTGSARLQLHHGTI